MDVERNVGGLDRRVRAVVGVALVLASVVAIASGAQVVGLVAGLGGAGLLCNAATQFCGVNALFGVNTCRRSD
jgi:hypothetical protein